MLVSKYSIDGWRYRWHYVFWANLPNIKGYSGLFMITLVLFVGQCMAPLDTVRAAALAHERARQSKQVSDQASPVEDLDFVFSQNFEPPGDGRPDSSRASGARTGSCSAANTLAETVTPSMLDSEPIERRIRALVPTAPFGLTLQSHPVIFINFDGEVAPFVVMRVEDESGHYDERVTLPIESDQPIQGFALPSNRPPLDVGKNYKWTILVACDGQVNPYHPIFSGWIQRVAPHEITTEILQQPISDQLTWYTNHGYWYDLVATLYQTLQTTPTDSTMESLWMQLLVFVDSD